MAIDLPLLKTELDADPLSLGYAIHLSPNPESPQGAADLLNTIGASGEVIDVTVVDAITVSAAVVVSEFLALTDGEQGMWLAIVGRDEVPVKNPDLRAQILAIWAGGTTTRTNLTSLQSRSASRGEALFGEGILVTHEHVSGALRL
jgi:hypothetical protein